MRSSFCLLVVMIILGVLLSACAGSGDSDFTIKVAGDQGMSFSGSYMVVTSGGQSISRSVDGIVPTQYVVRGSLVSVAFQKQTQYGTLRVEILKGGKLVAQSQSSAAYGVVSVATQ